MKARRCGSLWIELLVVIAASALLAGVAMASIEGLLAGIRRDAAGQDCSARLGHLRALLQVAWSAQLAGAQEPEAMVLRATPSGGLMVERMVVVYVDAAGGRRVLTWDGSDSSTGRLQVGVPSAEANPDANAVPSWLEFPAWGQLHLELIEGGTAETPDGPTFGESLPAVRCRFPAANCRAARRGFLLQPYG